MVNNSSKNNLSKKKNQSFLRSSPIINRNYLPDQTINKIKYSFRDNNDFPSISLINFFDKKIYFFIQKELSHLKLIHQKNPPLYSYSRSHLTKYLNSFFNREDLRNFLAKISERNVKKVDLSYSQFSHKDYMLLHDLVSKEEKDSTRYDLIFDLTPNWNKEWGGTIFYVDRLGNHHPILSYPNTLTLIERKIIKRKNNDFSSEDSAKLTYYLKYINQHAKNKKRLLIMGRIITSK